MKFFEKFGVYGLVPILSKSIGFLLIPLYTHYLSVSEFGIQDIYLVFKNFAAYFIELEFYAAVGRYFFVYKNKLERKKLISTAFGMQMITSFFILFFLVLFHERFYDVLIEQDGFKDVYWIILAWIPFSGLVSFFSVIVRYDNKAKQFLYLTIGQLLVRVILTIFLVAYLDMGVKGVFIGQLTGSIFASIAYYILLKNYFIISFDKSLVKLILKYSLPLVPGLLFMSFGVNLSKYLIRTLLSIDDVGLYALALRLVGLFSVLGLALKMTWQPFYFELVANDSEVAKNKVIDIYQFFFYFLMFFTIIMTLFSNEMVSLIAPQEYYEASKIIGLLCLAASIRIITQIAKIGINQANKTILITYISTFSVGLLIVSLYLFLEKYGLIVIPLAGLVSAIIGLLISSYYTNKFIGISLPVYKSIFVISLVTIFNIFLMKYDISIIVKLIILTVIIISILPFRRAILMKISSINS